MALPDVHHIYRTQQSQGVPAVPSTRNSKRAWPTSPVHQSAAAPAPASLHASTSAVHALPLAEGLAHFLDELISRNLSELTICAYHADLRQLLAFLHATDMTVRFCHQVQRRALVGFLADLARSGRSGVTRARKLASLREFFRFLEREHSVQASPAAGISMPQKERKERVWLRPDEYARLLAAAGGNARDFAILQLFLQTGLRVTELVRLRLSDVDVTGRTLRVQGKGNKERTIDLEKKGLTALKNYLQVRAQSTKTPDTAARSTAATAGSTAVADDHLFLNYRQEGLSRRGVQKLVEVYRQRARLTKKVSCHSLRHTFASYKAGRGVSAFQLQQWLGHSSVTTTQIYVHLAHAQASQKLMEQTGL